MQALDCEHGYSCVLLSPSSRCATNSQNFPFDLGINAQLSSPGVSCFETVTRTTTYDNAAACLRTSVFAWRLDQLTCLQGHNSKTSQEHKGHNAEEQCCDVGNLQLTEHEGQKRSHSIEQSRRKLGPCPQIHENSACHREAEGHHHHQFHQRDAVERTLAAVRTFTCQVEAAEQRVGLFNQELRPIHHWKLRK